MPRIAKPLTAKQVQFEKRPGDYADGRGLYLRIVGNSRGWVFRYLAADGRRREHGLGPVADLSLADARTMTERLREGLRSKPPIDPIEAKRAGDVARSVPTFAAIAADYVAAKVAPLSAKSLQQWQGSLKTYVLPIIGEKPIDQIETADVLKVLNPIWSSKTETAVRVRGRMELILDFAKAKQLRTGENPALWGGHLKSILPTHSKAARTKHRDAVPYADIPAVVASLRTQPKTGARALEFLILTCTRANETMGAAWSEIDLTARVWTIPAARMKASKEHRIPLSDRAVAILEQMERNSDLVFPGIGTGGQLGEAAMRKALKWAGSNATVHGFRSSFRDWTAEQTNTPDSVAEMALAHTIADAVEAAYRRGDLFEKRRILADAWARHCNGSNNVRQLRTA
jgi:integrase